MLPMVALPPSAFHLEDEHDEIGAPKPWDQMFDEVKGRYGEPLTEKAIILDVPGDGSCLYHALLALRRASGW